MNAHLVYYVALRVPADCSSSSSSRGRVEAAAPLLTPYAAPRLLLALRACSRHWRAVVDRSPELAQALRAHPFVAGRLWQVGHDSYLQGLSLDARLEGANRWWNASWPQRRNNWDSFRDVRCTMRMLQRLGALATEKEGRRLQRALDTVEADIWPEDLNLDTVRAEQEQDRLWTKAWQPPDPARPLRIRFGPLDAQCRGTITLSD